MNLIPVGNFQIALPGTRHVVENFIGQVLDEEEGSELAACNLVRFSSPVPFLFIIQVNGCVLEVVDDLINVVWIHGIDDAIRGLHPFTGRGFIIGAALSCLQSSNGLCRGNGSWRSLGDRWEISTSYRGGPDDALACCA